MMERDEDQPLLRAEGLSKWYGKQLGCRDVSFALYPSEVIAVVGESGSGKTTLLQLVSAQLAPSGRRGAQPWAPQKRPSAHGLLPAHGAPVLPRGVHTPSMVPGLVKDDRILVEKPSYWFGELAP